MIQLRSGDLVSLAANGRFYYALILDLIRLFGGNWTFVFHRTSAEPLAPDELLSADPTGFHAFVDFIHAKRERRITRIRRSVDCAPFLGPGRLKRTLTLEGKASQWFISDMQLNELARVQRLSPAEAAYPLAQCINEALLLARTDERWRPELDPRI